MPENLNHRDSLLLTFPGVLQPACEKEIFPMQKLLGPNGALEVSWMAFLGDWQEST